MQLESAFYRDSICEQENTDGENRLHQSFDSRPESRPPRGCPEGIEPRQALRRQVERKEFGSSWLTRNARFRARGRRRVVESISRLARSTKDLLSIVETPEHKGVGFVSLKEQIDTVSPTFL